MTQLALRIAIVLVGLNAAWVSAVFIMAVMRASRWRRAKERSLALQPQIRQALVDNLAGSSNLPELRKFSEASPQDMADTVGAFEGKVAGAAMDRLCETALELGLVHAWVAATRSGDPMRRRTAFKRLAFVTSFEPCRRLSGDAPLRALGDIDPEVRVSASRAVIKSGSPRLLEKVFDVAVGRNLLFRIRIADEFRRQSAVLCDGVIPNALLSGDPERVLFALQLLSMWERSIPFDDLRPLLENGDPRIRAQALHLAPLVPDAPEHRMAILRALNDVDAEAFTSAAWAAGRMRIQEAAPMLARGLRTGDPEQMRTAAAALAGLGPIGLKTLEEFRQGDNRGAAAAAAEVLERAQAGGFGYA